MCKTGAVKKAIFGMRELEIGKTWTRLEEVFVFAYVCDFCLSWEMFKLVSMMGKGPRNYRDKQCERSKMGGGGRRRREGERGWCWCEEAGSRDSEHRGRGQHWPRKGTYYTAGIILGGHGCCISLNTTTVISIS